MRPGAARIAVSAGRRDGAFAVPAAGSRGRAGMFVLAAAAGLALASGAVTGMPAAHAAATASAGSAAAVHVQPIFQPCPCDKPICRPGCSQGMASAGPASTIDRPAHLAAAQAVARIAATAVNCPPPSAPTPASQDGQPGC